MHRKVKSITCIFQEELSVTGVTNKENITLSCRRNIKTGNNWRKTLKVHAQIGG